MPRGVYKNHKKGYHLSKEHKDKIRKSHMGNTWGVKKGQSWTEARRLAELYKKPRRIQKSYFKIG